MLAAVAGLAAAAMVCLLLVAPPPATLVVEDVRHERLLFSWPAHAGERFVLSYRHSVSATRVTGLFEISLGGGVVVRETSFGTFGPGLPALRPGDRYEARDGRIRQIEINQPLPWVSVFVHPFTEHVVSFRGVSVDLSATLPSATLVRISAHAGR
jgi:hypothetical protein